LARSDVPEVPLAAARRFVVARQGFAARRRNASRADVEAAIDRLGCVQLDAISTVDRSQRLVLGARVGRLAPDVLGELLACGRVFEYWAHEASLIPVGDWPFFRAMMRDDTHHRWYGNVLESHPELVERVLDTVREQGPVSSRDFGGAGTGYWNWTPAKRVLEALWTAGELVIAARRGAERRYDLPERVLPDDALGAPEPSLEERTRYLIVRSVRARGVLREARIGDYYRFAGGHRPLRPVVERLCQDGVLARVSLGDAGPAVVLAEDAEELAAGDARPRGAHLLSPFDNLLWDRVDTAVLHGFEHNLEIYKPRSQRVYGYYVLPLLDGHELVGRVDTKADRQAGVLRALAVHWERRPRPRALREALARLAWRLGLEDTEVPNGGV
jgi:uncharacterized protein YcaQ